MTEYDVILERTTECPTAVVKASTTLREFPALWPALLDEVWAFLRATPGLRTNGHNVFLYRNDGRGAEFAVEVGVQVTKSFEAAGRVVPSILPAAETATTVHRGTPAQIGAAHDAVNEWCSKNGRELTGVSWEVYGDPDPQTGHFDVAVYRQLF
ncbi:MAG: GyrI-like domain-containing protein [Candidatus Dormiibacterota bacterium]